MAVYKYVLLFSLGDAGCHQKKNKHMISRKTDTLTILVLNDPLKIKKISFI